MTPPDDGHPRHGNVPLGDPVPDPAAEAVAQSIADHEAESDPHPQYLEAD